MNTDRVEPTPVASDDRAVSGLARGSTLSLAGAITQQACMLGTILLIARTLGSEELGRYSIAYAALTILTLVTMLGLKATLTRFVATHLADGATERVRPLLRLGLGTTTLSAGLAAVGLSVFAAPAATLFHEPGMAPGLRWVALCLPAFAVRDVALAASQGWRRQRSFTLIGWIYEPLARFVGTATAIGLGWGLQGAFAALAVGAWTAAFAAVLSLRRDLARLRPEPGAARDRGAGAGLLGFAAMSWATSLTSTGLMWGDTLLLGHFTDAESVGVYTVATRLVSLAIFVMAPINAAFAPHFAHHYHRGELARAARLHRVATGWVFRLSAPAFALLLVCPEELLALFGPGYALGAAVTTVLATGQLVNAMTGPSGTALTMSGKVRLNLANNAAVLVLNLGLNLWLIPRYGALGAALSWSVALSVVNLARLLQLRRLVGGWPFDATTAKTATAATGAGLAGALAATAVGSLTPDWGPALLLGGLTLAVVYLGTSGFLGPSAEEREAIAAVRRRLGRP